MTKILSVHQNVIFSLINQFVPLLVGLISIPIIIQSLGFEKFGLLTLGLGFLGYLSLTKFGVDKALIRFLSEYYESKSTKKIFTVIWTGIKIQSVIALLLTLIILSIQDNIFEIMYVPEYLANEAKDMIFNFSLMLFPVLINNLLRSILEAIQRFDLVMMIRIPSRSTYFLIMAIGGLNNLSISTISYFLMISQYIFLLIYVIIIEKNLTFLSKFKYFGKNETKILLSFGSWVTVVQLISPILLTMDKFLINYFTNLENVTFYGTSQDLIIYLNTISIGIVSVLFPKFVEFITKKKISKLISLFKTTISLLNIIYAYVFIINLTLGSYLLEMWVDKIFSVNSIAVYIIFSVGLFFWASMITPFHALFNSLDKTKIPAKIQIYLLPFIITLSVLMINKYGLLGGAIIWSSRFIVESLLLFRYFIKEETLDVKIRYKGIIKFIIKMVIIIVLTSSMIFGSIKIIQNINFYWILVIIIISGIFYLFFVWMMIMEEETKLRIQDLIRNNIKFL